LRLLLAAVLLSTAAGCALRLSDPVYAFKEIRAEEPKQEGASLLFGTIEVEEWMTGDLDTVTLVKLGPGATRSYRGANRVNLFRVFFPRRMKDGNFVIEVGPGLYELERFSTSGWGQPRIWNAKPDARKSTRFLVTRPGVFDIGTIRVTRNSMTSNSYEMERVANNSPARQAILQNAIAGTRWQHLTVAAK
jgi:hypothetical protein